MPASELKLKHLLQWALVPIFDTLNQVFMKLIGQHLGEINFGLDWLVKAVASPYLWCSFAADTGSFVTWMLILKRANLSFAMPISSICYITILLVSWLGFHEIISLTQLLGVILIMSGIAIISHDESRQPPKVNA